jgi:hypothetical protein
MKVKIVIALLLAIATGCKVGNVAHSGGVDNQSYLQFLKGSKSYSSVTVHLDDLEPFTAKVDKIQKLNVRGNVYAVKEGTHTLKVTSPSGETLYERKIVIGNQETKQITLP